MILQVFLNGRPSQTRTAPPELLDNPDYDPDEEDEANFAESDDVESLYPLNYF